MNKELLAELKAEENRLRGIKAAKQEGGGYNFLGKKGMAKRLAALRAENAARSIRKSG